MPRVREETPALTESRTDPRASARPRPADESWFADALAGRDGTADVPPVRPHDEVFPDPLVILPERRAAKARAIPAVTADAPAPLPVVPPARQRVPAPAAGPALPAPRPRREPRPQIPAQQWAPPQQWAPARPPARRPPQAAARTVAVVRQAAAPASPSYPTAPALRATRPARPLRAAPVRTQRAAPARTPQAVPARPPLPASRRGRRRTGGAWTFLFVVILFLVMSGAGRQILNALMDLLNR